MVRFYSAPFLHPNGFIQIYLNETGSKRLHIWPDEPMPKQLTDSPIHNHTFAFRSKVILGVIENQSYDFFVNDTNPQVRIYTTSAIDQINTILVPTDLVGNMILRKTELIEKGFEYEFPAKAFHQSKWYGLTATIMEKTSMSTGSAAAVVCPIDQVPDNDFRRERVDPKFLDKFIQRVKHHATDYLDGFQ